MRAEQLKDHNNADLTDLYIKDTIPNQELKHSLPNDPNVSNEHIFRCLFIYYPRSFGLVANLRYGAISMFCYLDSSEVRSICKDEC
ncbi:hypothetical protein ACOME3_009884 [Neoechinorhynchus agilis]